MFNYLFRNSTVNYRFLSVLFIMLLIIASFLLMGNSKQITRNFKLPSNDIVMTSLEKDKITRENNEKFGQDYKTAKLNLHIKETGLVKEYERYKDVEVEIKGVIHTTSSSFPYNGKGYLQSTKLNNQEIFWGVFDITIKHKGGEEEGILTIRYRPGTEDIDVSVTAGDIYSTGMIYFGNTFLNQEEIFEILYMFENN